jgi:hypothetical protein
MIREERAAIIRKANETLSRSREELRTAESMRTPPDRRRDWSIDEADEAEPLEFRTTTTPGILKHKCSCSPHHESAPADQNSDHWDGWEKWLAARLRRERRLITQSVGEALGQMLAKEREDYKRELSDEVRQLRIELSNLESTISELRSLVKAERAKVIDLPPLLRRAN